jgi:hypothetical protein
MQWSEKLTLGQPTEEACRFINVFAKTSYKINKNNGKVAKTTRAVVMIAINYRLSEYEADGSKCH